MNTLSIDLFYRVLKYCSKLSLSFYKLLHFFINRIIIVFILHISLTIVHNVKAADELETILDTLQELTCETQGAGNLLRSEFTHTCIPAPFFTFAIANIISPGLYASTFLRLAINDNELFPNACERQNRIDFSDQKLSFALCSNKKLLALRGEAIAKTGVAIAKSAFTGNNPWDEIVENWDIDKESYHEIFEDIRENDSGEMWDVGPIPYIPWKVIKTKDKMCVATMTLGFSYWMPVGCKYIKEPFPVSIYADFMDISPEGQGELEKLTSLTSCSNMGSCYKRAYDNSRSAIVMTGPIIECVKEMIAKLMISNSVCSFDDVKYVINSNARTSSALYQFQRKMHQAVTALLTIYIILFGFKVVLSGDMPPKSELVNFVIKFLFVTYFSVGININAGSGSELDRLDGMVQWVFPFLLGGMTEMAGWIINASPSELCKFSDIQYPPNLTHLQLWDSLDCKISHYLGLDAIQTHIIENATRLSDFSKFDGLNNPIPPYVFLLVPAIISGYPQLVSLALMYPLLVISIAAFVVNATIVCMISIVVLGVLAPLFVPMFLFDYTRAYFDAWLKLLISFMLQPMVVIVFMTTLMSVYDFGFYGTCKYEYKNFTYSGPELNIELNGIPGGANSAHRPARYYFVDQDWKNSYSTQEEIDGCKNSLGFMLNNPLDAIVASPGLFLNMVELKFDKIKVFTIAMLTACLILYLMYHFSESLAEFAADMTEGVSIGNMAIKPQTMFKAGLAAADAAGGGSGGQGGPGGGNASGQGASGGGDRSQGASDKMSAGEASNASDKASTQRESGKMSADDKNTASDKASTQKKPEGSGDMGQMMSSFAGKAASSAGDSFNTSEAVSSSVKKENTESEGNKGESETQNQNKGNSPSEKSSDDNLTKEENKGDRKGPNDNKM
jgi:type IV secretion system protein VirB6